MTKYYLIIISIIIFISIAIFTFVETKKIPIRVGVIHSQTGAMANSEKSVLKATLLAIDQINTNGGLMGRMIEAVVIDGSSQAKNFSQGVQELIDQGVTTIFGGWTSSSRKEMLPILEKNNALLFYPLQYEGFESSPNIVYLGLSANQQIIPTINYAVERFGKRVFLIGSDYIYPHISNKFIKNIASYTDIEIVGEEYANLYDNNIEATVAKIKKLQPSFIINTLNGDSNIAFFKALQDQNISLLKTALFSFSLEETHIESIGEILGMNAIEGMYATWGYFNAIESKQNRELNTIFKDITTLNDPAYSAYMGVQLWAKTVEQQQRYDTATIKKYIKKQSIEGVGGAFYISPTNNHTWRNVSIARVDSEGHFQIVWYSQTPKKPKPFPEYIDKKEIDQYTKELYMKWGESYEAPREQKGD